MSRSVPDCLVIGAGLLGMLSALELRQRGLSVLVLERGRVGAESSWAGGGILSPLYPWRYPPAVTRLAAWSQQRYPVLARELAEATGIDPQWTASGLLILEQEEADEALAWARSWQQEVTRLDGAACRELEPALGRVPDHALWLPGVAQIRNPRLIQSLRQRLAALGVVIREGTEVQALSLRDGRIQGVAVGSGERIAAPRVVVAGGAWSGRLLRSVGIDLQVYPVKGQMLLYKAPPGRPGHIVMRHGRYVIPRRDGHVLAGSSVEKAGFDKSPSQAVRQELQAAVRELVPSLAGCPLLRHWAGLRPGCRDGVPFIGSVPPFQGLYVNTGHFRNGVVLAPASARLLADILTGEPPLLDPAPYDPAARCQGVADFLSV
ncbi:MAG TPA: glycine oxidase ThiO [Gammaproteobacteria bacterium]|nr:glycine oxidase ThiO [Gammaproteobacteria bacterium]